MTPLILAAYATESNRHFTNLSFLSMLPNKEITDKAIGSISYGSCSITHPCSKPCHAHKAAEANYDVKENQCIDKKRKII